MVVQARQQPRRPRAVGFKESGAQPRKTFKNTAARETHQRRHWTEAVGERVPQHQLVIQSLAEVVEIIRTAPVKYDRDPELLTFRPKSIVMRVVPWTLVDLAG